MGKTPSGDTKAKIFTKNWSPSKTVMNLRKQLFTSKMIFLIGYSLIIIGCILLMVAESQR